MKKATKYILAGTGALAAAGVWCAGQHLAEARTHGHRLRYAVDPYRCHPMHLLSLFLFYTQTKKK